MASDTSPLLWADTHRGLVAAAAVTATAAAVMAARLIRRA
jgi:hypothetical protein